jgi:hypothetical protein
MLFYKCFDWFKKLRLFVNERNLKIDVVLKASHAVLTSQYVQHTGMHSWAS